MVVNKPTLRNLTDKKYALPPEFPNAALQDLVKPHIDSFNYMVQEGLNAAVKSNPPVEFSLPNGQRVSLFVTDAFVNKPAVPKTNTYAFNPFVYPSECRQGLRSYRGQLVLRLCWKVDGVLQNSDDFQVGPIPIMVKSVACATHGLKPAELIRVGEEAEEMGGYFISNGIEKVIRMLIMPLRNYPLALNRPSWKNRGALYTEYGIFIRSVSEDQTSQNVVLHYLNNGAVTISIFRYNEQFYIPLILVLKALLNTTDHHIYTELIKGKEEDPFYKGCIMNMMRQAQDENLSSHHDVTQFIGRTFRIRMELPEWYTNSQVTEYLLKYFVLIHLNNNTDKFNLMIMMAKKLYSFSAGECAVESQDNPMFQEILLPGHLYQMALKEKVLHWLDGIKNNIIKAAAKHISQYTLDQAAVNRAVKGTIEIGRHMAYLIASGCLKFGSLGLSQSNGLTVVADKLNFMRFLSHFRCVHRGAFFTQMRTTSVRKLLGEAWGFLCPVHTPDGPPCGLMNHLSATCHIVTVTLKTSHIAPLLCGMGMTPIESVPQCPYSQCYPVLLNGVVIGWLPFSIADDVVEQLRMMKVLGLNNISKLMEIGYVKKTNVASQYPGLSLFTEPARMMRPVINLAYNTTEMIGIFEQAYMSICVIPEEAYEGITTHQEISEHSMLSAVASLTPFSDFNQSPRNMYQCQMGKQTMGFPLQAWQNRSDNKLYRLQTPQSPLVRPYMHDVYGMDNYPLGTNAIVAVISYTGYDMEDAMILSKSSYERGFGHGSIYKAQLINLEHVENNRAQSRIFACSETDPAYTSGQLCIDGLPPIGTYLKTDSPFYSYIDLQTNQMKIVKYVSQEPAWVDNIKIVGEDKGTRHLSCVNIILRIQRNPIIGDKFSSRHGQKGICSQKWPVENMPFSETGITPDILFNPHGFPSRMTIGMMIESMAGKSAVCHGLVHDATPFTFTEDQPPIEYFGTLLTKAGYNYYGTERMYSGVDGREFEADIFMGVVYYQRLRHMVSDKFQVRTTGAIDPVTRQPVQGRKRGGGVRFGEMERDALLAHGTSFLLHDRLFNCSDESKGYVCISCGSILSPVLSKPASLMAAVSYESRQTWSCLSCKRKDTVKLVRMPFVFRYMAAELASVNIKMKLNLESLS